MSLHTQHRAKELEVIGKENGRKCNNDCCDLCIYLFILGIPVIKQEEAEEGEN